MVGQVFSQTPCVHTLKMHGMSVVDCGSIPNLVRKHDWSILGHAYINFDAFVSSIIVLE